MKRLPLTLPVALILALTAATSSVASTERSGLLPLPSWLKPAETQTLDRVFGGARPIRTWYASYPHKIAVTFVFNRVVICGACSAPSNANLPRGRAIRVSYNRQTHKESGAMRFCESTGSSPPLSSCLRR
jgi:hypothetical protein